MQRARSTVLVATSVLSGKYEVTRGQYATFVRETGRAVGDGCWTHESGEWEEHSGRSWRTPGYGQDDTHPVVCVSHEEAQAYARWLWRDILPSARRLAHDAQPVHRKW